MSLRMRRASKATKEEVKHRGESKELECQQCGTLVENVSFDAKAVTCSRCVAKMTAPPDCGSAKKEPIGPRGWQFKKVYIASSGDRYEYGRKVDAPSTSTASASSEARTAKEPKRANSGRSGTKSKSGRSRNSK